MEKYILTKRFRKGFSVSGNPPVYFTREIGESAQGEVITAPYTSSQFLRVPFIVYGQNRYVDIPFNMLRKKEKNNRIYESKSSFDSMLITLEGTAQEKGKKVTGYKFPDNLDDLKFPFKMLFHPNYAVGLKETTTLDGVTTTKNIDVPLKEVIFIKRNGNKLLTKEGYFRDVSKGVFDKNRVVISPEKINTDKIPNIPKSVSKQPTTNASLEQDLNNSDLGKTARKIQIGFSVVGWGVFGILAYKFWNKSTTWKVILSVFGAYNLYSTYKVFSKPALQVEGGSNTGTSTGKETSTGSSTSTSTNTVNNTDYSNLNKYQKIDLIIQNQSGGEPMDADEINSTKAFLNILTDAELTIWIPLSKALKDSEVSQAGESGDKQKLYNLLQSKYGLTQQQVDEQMKKFGEFLMGSIQTAMGDSQFTGKNDMFSNFESSLNLDL